jgi:SAM-dependent methyltransferase
MKTAFKQKDGSVKWVGYQDLPGIKGDRKVEERRLFIEEDFKGASVLDIGCWAGQMMLEAKRMGAKKVLGIEIDRDAIKVGRSLGLKIERDDLENQFFWKELPKFDIVMNLAILGNMKNKVAVLSNASQKADIMYVEGHGRQHKFSRADWMDLFLTYTDYTTIEHLGTVQTRPFFRLSRELKDLDYIKSKGYKKIAIIGKPGAGKTTLTKEFDCTIFSDVETGIEGDEFVVDNHGALLLADYDCVINVLSDKRLSNIAKREKRKVDKEIEDFNDTVSPLYKKGNYDFYTIKLNQ